MVTDATEILERFPSRCVSLCSISFSSIHFVFFPGNSAAAVAAAAALPAAAPHASNDASSPPRAQPNRTSGHRRAAVTTPPPPPNRRLSSPREALPPPPVRTRLSPRGAGRAKLFGDGGYFGVPDRARQRRGCGRSGEPCWACGGFERLCGAPAGGSARPILVAWGGQYPRLHERSVRICSSPGPGCRAASGGDTRSRRQPPASFSRP